MSKSFRASTMRLALAGAVVTLGVAGTAAGVAAASAAPSRHITQPPLVDHQLCYTAAGLHFRIPSGVRLIDQFSPNGFVPRISFTLDVHCNPVEKILPTGQIIPITNPSAHLACFPLAPASPQPTPTVQVTNQFGTGTLIPGQPNIVCLPSWKSLTGPPGKTPTTPPGLNHFTCYPVKLAPGSPPYHPPPVMLKDEFARAPVKATVNPVPQELCLPTEKIVGTHVFPIINPAAHLLCFPVTATPVISKVWDENQFGTSVLTVHATNWLCVPSTKKIVG